jgi:hypothetical protein
MKKLAIIIVLTSLFTLAFEYSAQAQCKQQFVYTCARKGGNAIYLKDFNTKLKNDTKTADNGTRWTTVLNEGIRYRFILCIPEAEDNDIIMTLYDSQHPEKTKPWNSTEGGKEMFDFICRRSGMYYISIRYTDDSKKRKTCAVGIQAFVGKNQ